VSAARLPGRRGRSKHRREGNRGGRAAGGRRRVEGGAQRHKGSGMSREGALFIEEVVVVLKPAELWHGSVTGEAAGQQPASSSSHTARGEMRPGRMERGLRGDTGSGLGRGGARRSREIWWRRRRTVGVADSSHIAPRAGCQPTSWPILYENMGLAHLHQPKKMLAQVHVHRNVK
jgi:hypothetical protein